MDAIKGLIERTVYVEAVIEFFNPGADLISESNKQFGFLLQKLGRCYDNKKDPHVQYRCQVLARPINRPMANGNFES